MKASRGRALSQADDESGARPAVLGDTAWKTIFVADPEILGKTILLNRVPFVVVGIMPPGFQFPMNMDRIDLYTTVAADLQTDRRQAEKTYPRDLQVLARLSASAILSQAQAEVYTLVAAITSGPADRKIDREGLVAPLATEMSRTLISPLKVLMGAIGCVLVLACATVGILTMIRVIVRRGEFATRLALGATRVRLIRQLMAESAVIALAGSAVGVLVAYAGTMPLLRLAGPDLAPVARIQFDFASWGFPCWLRYWQPSDSARFPRSRGLRSDGLAGFVMNPPRRGAGKHPRRDCCWSPPRLRSP